jgi:P4 family phage/plasmid primase-like protien
MIIRQALGPEINIREHVVLGAMFNHKRDNVPQPFEKSISGLLGRHEINELKEPCPGFALACFKEGGKRCKEDVVAMSGLILDFDKLTEQDAQRVLGSFEGLAHVVCSTFSHLEKGPDHWCFRVFLACTRSMTPEEFHRLWDEIDRQQGHLADRSGRTTCQMFYFPRCPPTRADDALLVFADGAALDVDAFLETCPKSSPKRSRKKKPDATVKASPNTSSGGRAFLEGSRNAELTRIAGGMRRRGLSEASILAALLEENKARCSPPLGDKEVESIAKSICKYDAEGPLLDFNTTDLGNAERIESFWGKDLRYVHELERWHCWDGQRWKQDRQDLVIDRAGQMVRAFTRQAEALGDEERRGRLLKHAMRSESQGKLRAMLSLAQPRLAISQNELDSHRWLLNAKNGTLDLTTGELHSHRRSDFITQISPVRFDPSADCPRWMTFLHEVMGGDEEMVGFLRRAVGYSLSASMSEQVFFILMGRGSNGKTLFIDQIRSILGDYAKQADFSTFLKQDSPTVRNDLARLQGARFVAAVEADPSRPLDEVAIKQFTGGDVVTCRYLYREHFEYRPVFKLWLAANSLPIIRGTDPGIWRRIILIPFNVSFSGNVRDRGLQGKLQAELPGILTWALKGFQDWNRVGLGVPDTVLEAVEAYRAKMDAVGGFISECCTTGDAATAKAGELYDAYRDWVAQEGMRDLLGRKHIFEPV